MYRGTFAVVDLQAITENVKNIRQHLRLGTRMLMTVKANGYGHGAVRVAKTAVQAGVDYLGVASVEEGLVLRQAGITAPILVLGAVSAGGAKAAAEHKIDVTMTPEALSGPFSWTDTTFTPALRVHLKFDTGMTRLGARERDEVVALAVAAAQRPDIHIQGVFTHLACADAQTDTHAKAQIERFHDMLGVLKQLGIQPPLVHAANSAGALRNPDWHFDMVRVGISGYGYAPDVTFQTDVPLQPALHLYSLITRVQEIAAGDTVGYGATFTAQQRTKIATVPVGYADGYSRLLSNRGIVVVRGQEVPVVGNVCMDQLMIDVTNLPTVQAGDCVTLYGRHAPDDWNRITLTDAPIEEAANQLASSWGQYARRQPILSLDTLAGLMGTISYELMCALSLRVPRVYFDTTFPSPV